MFERQVTLQIDPDVIEVAEHFCEMTSEQWAIFFSHVAFFASKWDRGGLPMMLQHVNDSTKLTDEGRYFMKLVGEYSEKDQSMKDVD